MKPQRLIIGLSVAAITLFSWSSTAIAAECETEYDNAHNAYMAWAAAVSALDKDNEAISKMLKNLASKDPYKDKRLSLEELQTLMNFWKDEMGTIQARLTDAMNKQNLFISATDKRDACFAKLRASKEKEKK